MERSFSDKWKSPVEMENQDGRPQIDGREGERKEDGKSREIPIWQWFAIRAAYLWHKTTRKRRLQKCCAHIFNLNENRDN